MMFFVCLFFSQIQSITDSSRGSIRRKNPSALRSQRSAEEGAGAAEKLEEEVKLIQCVMYSTSVLTSFKHLLHFMPGFSFSSCCSIIPYSSLIKNPPFLTSVSFLCITRSCDGVCLSAWGRLQPKTGTTEPQQECLHTNQPHKPHVPCCTCRWCCRLARQQGCGKGEEPPNSDLGSGQRLLQHEAVSDLSAYFSSAILHRKRASHPG